MTKAQARIVTVLSVAFGAFFIIEGVSIAQGLMALSSMHN